MLITILLLIFIISTTISIWKYYDKKKNKFKYIAEEQWNREIKTIKDAEKTLKTSKILISEVNDLINNFKAYKERKEVEIGLLQLAHNKAKERIKDYEKELKDKNDLLKKYETKK